MEETGSSWMENRAGLKKDTSLIGNEGIEECVQNRFTNITALQRLLLSH